MFLKSIFHLLSYNRKTHYLCIRSAKKKKGKTDFSTI
nr:MAG TPA: hypothetical protein [Caudoviricetes sp.]